MMISCIKEYILNWQNPIISCWSLSALIWLCSIAVFLFMLLFGSGRKLPVSPLKVLIIGTGISVVLVYWPYHLEKWEYAPPVRF